MTMFYDAVNIDQNTFRDGFHVTYVTTPNEIYEFLSRRRVYPIFDHTGIASAPRISIHSRREYSNRWRLNREVEF